MCLRAISNTVPVVSSGIFKLWLIWNVFLVFLFTRPRFYSCAIEDCCNLRFCHAKFHAMPRVWFFFI